MKENPYYTAIALSNPVLSIGYTLLKGIMHCAYMDDCLEHGNEILDQIEFDMLGFGINDELNKPKEEE